MKNFQAFLLIASLLVYSIGCNNTGDNSASTGDSSGAIKSAVPNPPDPCEGIDKVDLCKDAGGVGNLVVEASVAQKMIANFTTSFKTEAGKDIRAFEPVYWLDKCAIQGIATFLRTRVDPTTKKQLDGIRIFIACETTDNPAYGTDTYKRRTSVNIFPTYFEKGATPDKSDHKTSQQKITLTGICSSAYFQDYAKADPENKEFKKIYRKEGTAGEKKNLSESVWLDACVIYTLEKLIALPNASIDGVSINMAAYDHLIQPTTPVRGRFDDIQSTVILAPTHIVGGKRENYWDIVDCLFQHAKTKGWAPPGGFNHGELCPQQCE